MRVWIDTDAKNDQTIYASAVAAVRHRIEEIYQYERLAVLDSARHIIELAKTDPAHADKLARTFLRRRDSYEYEGITEVEVIS